MLLCLCKNFLGFGWQESKMTVCACGGEDCNIFVSVARGITILLVWATFIGCQWKGEMLCVCGWVDGRVK